MTTTFKWLAGEGAQSALTTELNSLANGNTALSAAINNDADLYEYIDLELYLASFATSTSPWIAIWILASVDGSNYEDGSAGTPGTIPDRQPDAIIPLKASTTSAWRRCAVNIPIPPLKLKLLLNNQTGATFASSGNTLKYNRHNEQVV